MSSDHQETKAKLERENTSIARASERDKPISMAQDIAGYAAEATQHVEEVQMCV